MGGTFKDVIYLNEEELLFINKEMILRFGGFFISADDNIGNRHSLKYIVDAVKTEIYGQELFPTIFEKAAAYAFYIIKDHVFHDGNKRTGIETALVFLGLNGYILKESVSTEDMVSLALSIEKGTLGLKKIARWFSANTIEK